MGEEVARQHSHFHLVIKELILILCNSNSLLSSSYSFDPFLNNTAIIIINRLQKRV